MKPKHNTSRPNYPEAQPDQSHQYGGDIQVPSHVLHGETYAVPPVGPANDGAGWEKRGGGGINVPQPDNKGPRTDKGDQGLGVM